MWKFKAEDFDTNILGLTREFAARLANDKLEMWLAEAPTFYGNADYPNTSHWGLRVQRDDTHKAKLINIEPIKRDTAEDVLREFVEHWEKEWVGKVPRSVFERAKAVLNK